jgi:hypothetical protein
MGTTKLTFSNPLERETSSESLKVAADQSFQFDVIGGPDKGNFSILGGPDRDDFDVMAVADQGDFDVVAGKINGDFAIMGTADLVGFDVLGFTR